MFSDSFKSFKELNLMQVVKKEIAANLKVKKLERVFTSQINYFKYSEAVMPNIENGEIKTFENVIEIDLTAAYFYATVNLGLLSFETLNRILAINKRKRLSILGSIASRKMIFEYKGGKLISEIPTIVVNEELRNVWFFICREVDRLIVECSNIAKEGFLFYYVDGIYFTDNSRKTRSAKISELMLKRGFPNKKIYIDKFEVTKADDNFIISITKQMKPKPKVFKVSKNRIRYVRKSEYSNYE